MGRDGKGIIFSVEVTSLLSLIRLKHQHQLDHQLHSTLI